MFFKITPMIVINKTKMTAIEMEFLICPIKVKISDLNCGYFGKISVSNFDLLKI